MMEPLLVRGCALVSKVPPARVMMPALAGKAPVKRSLLPRVARRPPVGELVRLPATMRDPPTASRVALLTTSALICPRPSMVSSLVMVGPAAIFPEAEASSMMPVLVKEGIERMPALTVRRPALSKAEEMMPGPAMIPPGALVRVPSPVMAPALRSMKPALEREAPAAIWRRLPKERWMVAASALVLGPVLARMRIPVGVREALLVKPAVPSMVPLPVMRLLLTRGPARREYRRRRRWNPGCRGRRRRRR